MKRKILSLLLVTALAITLMMPAQVAHAKVKDGWYGTSLIEEGYYSEQSYIKKIKIKGKKITTYGSFEYAKSLSKFDSGKTKMLKAKKRTVKIKKFVAYGYGGEGRPAKYNAKLTKEILKSYNGLYVVFQVKKGKIVKVQFYS